MLRVTVLVLSLEIAQSWQECKIFLQLEALGVTASKSAFLALREVMGLETCKMGEDMGVLCFRKSSACTLTVLAVSSFAVNSLVF